MSGSSKTQILAEARAAFDKLREVDQDGSLLFSLFYTPDVRLQGYLDEFEALCSKGSLTKSEATRIGVVLEVIALLAFKSLDGWTDVAAFTSVTAQHDLLVHGASAAWQELMKALHLNEGTGQFLIEAKATAAPVDSTQFLRLCALVAQMKRTVGLGVFLARSDATGFPADGDVAQAAIGDARLTQVLFHSSADRPIVVLNRADIATLGNPGALPTLLERKIRDIVELSGKPTMVDVQKTERLPKHLADLMDPSNSSGTDHNTGTS